MEGVDRFENGGKRIWIMQPEKLIVQCHLHHLLIYLRWLNSGTKMVLNYKIIYLVAHNPEKKCIGIYALDRIQRLELADKTFTFPETFDAEAYFRDSYGIMVPPEELDVETIRIKVSDKNNKRKYLRLLPLHHSQEKTEKHSDYSVFTYRLYPTYDFFQEILSHGGEVEVLSPEWVRKEFKELIEDMLRQYLP